jgi:large subunit ribosomal protein L29
MKKNIKEISSQSDKELTESLSNKREELFKLTMDLKENKLKNTRSIFNTRKDIARILTLIKERELAGLNAQEKGAADEKAVAGK